MQRHLLCRWFCQGSTHTTKRKTRWYGMKTNIPARNTSLSTRSAGFRSSVCGDGSCGHIGNCKHGRHQVAAFFQRGKQMIDPFEIFALAAEDQYDWIASAPSLADAKKLMCEHAASNSGTFFVYSHRTGERTYYKVANDAEVVRLSGRPSTSVAVSSTRV
jgi:hypothetical protein